jgi:hypothetical protein
VSERFDATVATLRRSHDDDPRTIEVDGLVRSRSAVYHERLVATVLELDPQASEPLRLAAWAQHVRRWELPRASYPAGREGYRKWRSAAARMHADVAAEAMRRAGWDEDAIDRVRAIVTKTRLRSDPEVQLLEDAVCLVFLADELEAFAREHDRDQVVEILKKTWDKMSPRGHAVALARASALPEAVRELVRSALP